MLDTRISGNILALAGDFEKFVGWKNFAAKTSYILIAQRHFIPITAVEVPPEVVASGQFQWIYVMQTPAIRLSIYSL